MSEENQELQEEQQEEQQEETAQEESAVEWYIQIAEGKKAGPISYERLKGFAERGKIFPKTKVRNTGLEAVWMSAGAVPELFPGVSPEDYAETPAPPSEDKPTPEATPLEDVEPDVEESSSLSAEVTDDSQMVKKPKFMIDVGKKKDEKPTANKTKENKKPAFVINTGSSKKKEEPAEAPPEEPKKEEPKAVEEKKSDASSVASSSGIKISIGVPAEKKEAKKDVPKEKAGGFKFAIDPNASKKKEEEPAPIVDDTPPEQEAAVEEPVTETAQDDIEEPKAAEKKETSSPEIKISFGGAGKKKSDKKSGDRSASAFKVAVKPGSSSEPKVEEKKKSDESTVITKKPKDDPKAKEETDFEPKKPRSGANAFLKIVAVLSVLLAFGGAIGLITLGRETPGLPYSALLGGLIFLYGIMTGILAWSLNGIVSTKNE